MRHQLRSTFITLFATLGSITPNSALGQQQDLTQHFLAALRNHASVPTAANNVAIAEAQKQQSQADWFPSLTAISQHQYKDPVTGNSTTNSFGERYQHTATVALEQNLFAGGATAQAVKKNQAVIAAADWQVRHQYLQLFEQVSGSFYNLLILLKEKDNLQEQLQILRNRVGYLKSQAKIGRIKQTEVMSGESQYSRIRAELANTENLINLERSELKFLTGQEVTEAQHDSISDDDITEKSVDAVSSPAENPSPLIKSLTFSQEAAEREIKIARADYLPSVDIGAQYYLDRSGILSNSKWDITATASWEIFGGGATLGQVREKSLIAKNTELVLENARREQSRDFQATKDELKIRDKVIAELAIAVKLAEKSFQTHQSEFQRGLVSNLEVLQALNDFIEVRKQWDRQKLELRRSWIRLHILSGFLPPSIKVTDS